MATDDGAKIPKSARNGGTMVNAVTAFENRKDALRTQIAGAQDASDAIAAVTMTLEQVACDLAQDERDDLTRQRQLAVLALARRSPMLLRAARAEGQLVVEHVPAPAHKVRMGVLGAGGVILLGTAAHAALSGSLTVALLQVIGALLLCVGSARALQPVQERQSAKGIVCLDAEDLVREVGQICQAADICVSDLHVIEQERGVSRLTGTVDDAVLDLLSSMLEARASGREDLAVRVLGQAEQYLHMMGVEAVEYDENHAAAFDVLPTLSGSRTVRPALLQDGRVLRRGVAAVAVKREVGA